MQARFFALPAIVVVITLHPLAIAFDSFQVSSGNRAIQPAISGHIVVWSDARTGSFDVYGKNLSTHAGFTVSTAFGNKYPSAIDGDIVVWQGLAGISGKNIATGQDLGLLSSGVSEGYPAISGNIVVWQDYRSSTNNIWAKKLTSGSEFQVSSTESEYPAISGNLVVWQDARGSTYDIYGKDLDTSLEFPVCTTAAFQYTPKISGNIVVWMEAGGPNGTDIYGKNLVSGVTFPICTVAGNQDTPAINGNTVVWFDRRNTSYQQVYGMNLLSGEEFVVCSDPGQKTHLAVSNEYAVWEDHRNGATHEEIYAANIPGACCFADGNCQFALRTSCSGFWLGPDVACSAAPCSVVKGDLNCDSIVNFEDITYFVSALISGPTSCVSMLADMDSSGTIDGSDLQLFVDAILAQ